MNFRSTGEPPMRNKRKISRRGGERRTRDDRRAGAHVPGDADRRKRNVPVATDQRGGLDRRGTGRRTHNRRDAADRRH